MVKFLLRQILFIDRILLLISVLLFFAGVVFSIPVVKKNVRFLLCYPLWLWIKLKELLQSQPSFFKLFLLIFFFNSCSLSFNVLSGLTVVLPFLFSFFVGLNVGVIGYKEGGAKVLLLMFFSPHILFELPAVWFSTTLGMQIGSSIWLHANAVEVIKRGFSVYYQIIIPLLLIAALIEAVLISNHLRSSKHPAAFSDEPLDAQ